MVATNFETGRSKGAGAVVRWGNVGNEASSSGSENTGGGAENDFVVMGSEKIGSAAVVD